MECSPFDQTFQLVWFSHDELRSGSDVERGKGMDFVLIFNPFVDEREYGFESR